MTKFTLSFILGWFFTPFLASSLNLFRTSDLALAIIVFFPSLWLSVGLRNYTLAKILQDDISLPACIGIACVLAVSMIISGLVQVNYFFHWFTVA